MSTDQLSMSMFATRADYDEAVRAQHEQLTGPHKMGCDYKLVATEYPNEINELQQKHDDFVQASGHQIKPCRCGPDMCADSVACPRR